MAVMTQLQLEGSSTVYDLNDARISSTSVSTATHFLGTNSSVSAINPISAADLASVLGVLDRVVNVPANSDLLDYIIKPGIYTVNNVATARTITNGPITDGGYSVIVHRHHTSYTPVIAVAYCNQPANIAKVAVRAYISDTWGAWKFLAFE
jgi:hypothetical protein